MYRSGFEQRIAESLKKRKVKFTYESQTYQYFSKRPRAVCSDCGSKECFEPKWYTPDFFLPSGLIVEAKGKWTGADRKKHLAVREAHPDLDIRFVFQRNNKLSKNSITTYSDWCEKNGFDYAFVDIPDEWLE